MNKLLQELLTGGVISGETIALDATFIKAYSRRDPHNNKLGKSDPEARVGRNGKTFDLGYKLHVAIDAKSELPLAVIVAPANGNEKKYAPALFSDALKAAGQRVNTIVADSQYSSRKLRELILSHGVRAVIPYPVNQRRVEQDLLRVDKCFRTYGPESERLLYRFRAAIERVNSRLKEQLCLNRHRVRDLKNITVHALLCIIAMLFTAVVALRLNRLEKTRCITMLAR